MTKGAWRENVVGENAPTKDDLLAAAIYVGAVARSDDHDNEKKGEQSASDR